MLFRSPYLYNRVKDYKPLSFFIKSDFQLESKTESQPFLTSYTFFNLKDPDLEPIEILSPDEKRCYQFYFKVVESLKAQINGQQPNIPLPPTLPNLPTKEELEKATTDAKVTMRHFEEAVKKVKTQKDLKIGQKIAVPYYR